MDRLTQSILAKAFRGELMPQDPNDEPAWVLLERIRSEKVKIEPAKRQATLTAPRKVVGDVSLAILQFMKRGQEYSRVDIVDRLGISSYEWNQAIRELKKSGRIIQTGEKRNSRYRLVP